MLAALANLMIPMLHDVAAAASRERVAICTAHGLVTVIPADEDRRENGPRPFDPFCPDCPSCPLCPAFHAPPTLLSKAIVAVFSPMATPVAWPVAADISVPDHADWRQAFPRAPPADA